ncbi:uncharacterized protein LOC131640680 [Vicia villosa]|uniref:uncharacterized protein LOC131640680 n=1 Tax=Vicia villosa TaxID=3911 RepID=UPI00273B0812|nr:uncharacterized protein LOC131640680 [Vicia villosa]
MISTFTRHSSFRPTSPANHCSSPENRRSVNCRKRLHSLILPTNKYGLVGTKDGTLEIIDIGSGTRVEVIEARGGFVRTIAALANKLGFVTGSADHEVKFWDYQIKQKPGQVRSSYHSLFYKVFVCFIIREYNNLPFQFIYSTYKTLIEVWKIFCI